MDGREFDCVVIGGGVTGLGIADAVSARGRSVCVIERHKVASATSANSHCIIHGGFRYLGKLDFIRTVVSLREKRDLLRRFPEAVSPLPCIMPLAASGSRSRAPVSAAALLYRGLSRLLEVPHGAAEVVMSGSAPHIEALHGIAPHGVLKWWDGLLEDHGELVRRMTTELKSRSVEILEDRSLDQGRCESGRWRVSLSPEREIVAQTVVNAAGPWVDRVRTALGLEPTSRRWCKAFNVVLKHQIEPTYAVATQGVDGRLYFLVPRGGRTAIGTGYAVYDGDPTSVRVTDGEIAYFLEGVSRSLPVAPLTMDDVERVECGVLPLGTARDRLEPRLRSELTTSQSYFEMLSTKYTTFRHEGRRVARAVERYLHHSRRTR
jgi:glycerol-3-phosphate dehydrogenase